LSLTSWLHRQVTAWPAKLFRIDRNYGPDHLICEPQGDFQFYWAILKGAKKPVKLILIYFIEPT
jgi:hypothetical protein